MRDWLAAEAVEAYQAAAQWKNFGTIAAIPTVGIEQNNAKANANAKSTDLPLPELPRLLKLVCRRLPVEYRPAMIIASLPILGTLATRIRFEYLDRQEQSVTPTSLNSLLCRWRKLNRIDKTADGHWKRLQ